eukprot:TRINITY_DN33974_c0_g1_i1.p1 TRINITY_DN33974_c0_g1~~TRINITY_DN33974_c0_g1_i1.p1  ORF type:complete len:563 (-),score=76.07 TRINITY_DN33974_c0_g1_i1:336-2024(-)
MAQPATENRSNPAKWGPVGHAGFFTLANFLVYYERGLASGFMPLILKAFDVDQTAGGAMSAWAVAGFCVGAPLAGPLCKRFPHPIMVMGVGMIFMAFGSVWMGVLPHGGDWFQVKASRFFNGMGEAFFCIVAPPILDDVAPAARKSTYIGFYFTAIPIGMAFGIGITKAFGDWHMGRVTFIVDGLIWLVFAAYFMLRAETFSKGGEEQPAADGAQAESDAPPPRLSVSSRKFGGIESFSLLEPSAHASFASMHNTSSTFQRARSVSAATSVMNVARVPQWWLIALGYGMQTWFLGGATTWVVLYITILYNFEPQIIIGLGTVFTALVGSGLGGVVLDNMTAKIGSRLRSCCLMNLVLMACTCPICLILPLLEDMYIFFAAFFLGQFFIISSGPPINLGLMTCVPPAERGTALGMATFLMHIVGDVPSNQLYGIVADSIAMDSYTGSIPDAKCTLEYLTLSQKDPNDNLQAACKDGNKWAMALLCLGIYMSVLFFGISLYLSYQSQSVEYDDNSEAVSSDDTQRQSKRSIVSELSAHGLGTVAESGAPSQEASVEAPPNTGSS